jgi:putative ABC transport system ATP-binding protein
MPALAVQSLTFSYPTASWSLSVPQLSLHTGEQLLLQASSGSGKSTLLSLIAGLLEPRTGTIEVQGTRVHTLHGAARDRFRGRTIGMVFQTHHLVVGLSALENVLAAPLMAGLPVQATRGRELLSELGIVRVDARVDELSVGQQQRVAIARALMCKPALVLADEPTASLDPASAHAAMDLLQSSCRQLGAALLCVSHDPAMAARFANVQPLTSNEHAPSATEPFRQGAQR